MGRRPADHRPTGGATATIVKEGERALAAGTTDRGCGGTRTDGRMVHAGRGSWGSTHMHVGRAGERQSVLLPQVPPFFFLVTYAATTASIANDDAARFDRTCASTRVQSAALPRPRAPCHPRWRQQPPTRPAAAQTPWMTSRMRVGTPLGRTCTCRRSTPTSAPAAYGPSRWKATGPSSADILSGQIHGLNPQYAPRGRCRAKMQGKE